MRLFLPIIGLIISFCSCRNPEKESTQNIAFIKNNKSLPIGNFEVSMDFPFQEVTKKHNTMRRELRGSSDQHTFQGIAEKNQDILLCELNTNLFERSLKNWFSKSTIELLLNEYKQRPSNQMKELKIDTSFFVREHSYQGFEFRGHDDSLGYKVMNRTLLLDSVCEIHYILIINKNVSWEDPAVVKFKKSLSIIKNAL